MKISYRVGKGVEKFIVEPLSKRIEVLLSEYGRSEKGIGCVLDVGCGEQPLRSSLERLGLRYYGLDYQQNSKGNVDIITPIDESFEGELSRAGEFELIVCTEVLEHVVDWSRAYENLSKLLKSGGRLLITAPFIYQLHEEPKDFWRPTPYAIEHYGKSAGLRVIHKELLGDDLGVINMLLFGLYTLPKEKRLKDRLISNAFKIWSKIGQYLCRGKLRESLDVHGRHFMSTIYMFEK